MDVIDEFMAAVKSDAAICHSNWTGRPSPSIASVKALPMVLVLALGKTMMLFARAHTPVARMAMATVGRSLIPVLYILFLRFGLSKPHWTEVTGNGQVLVRTGNFFNPDFAGKVQT